MNRAGSRSQNLIKKKKECSLFSRGKKFYTPYGLTFWFRDISIALNSGIMEKNKNVAFKRLV